MMEEFNEYFIVYKYERCRSHYQIVVPARTAEDAREALVARRRSEHRPVEVVSVCAC